MRAPILTIAISISRRKISRRKTAYPEIFLYQENVATHYCGLLRLVPSSKSPHYFYVTLFFRQLSVRRREASKEKKIIRNRRGNSRFERTLYSLPNAVASSRPLFVPSSILGSYFLYLPRPGIDLRQKAFTKTGS